MSENELVRERCKAAKQGPAHASTRLPERIAGINALIEMITADSSAAVNAVATKAIRANIHEQFVHVIDPQAGDPDMQAHLNKIHGPPPHSGEPVYRC
jgi:hypothetical protein